MSKYLKLFENHTQYETFIGGGGNTPFVKPNVSYCTEENEVHYNPFSWADEYLTFDIVTEGTIVWKTSDSNNVKTILYSINNGEWTDITSSTTGDSFNVSVGDKVRFKGNNPAYGADSSSYNTFNGSTASFNVQGNIMSLLFGDKFKGKTDLTGKTYVFVYLFENANIINAKNLVLPATTLAGGCYYGMFKDCTSLVTAPTLSATTLASGCYGGMFEGCTSLKTAPELPATTLASSCYSGMFRDCTSLVTAPTLSATTLADSCYYGMFEGCTSLTTAPELPATTLADWCYYGMFKGCKSLTTAPELPVRTLAEGCYDSMFYSCSSLNYIKCLATNISASNCLSNWVLGVASTGTFVKAASMTSWTRDTNGIPSGWTVQDATE